jgi:hypothetical protein
LLGLERVFAQTLGLRITRIPSNASRGRSWLSMPTDSIQGLYFLLGLLLSFYFLVPFLELTVR